MYMHKLLKLLADGIKRELVRIDRPQEHISKMAKKDLSPFLSRLLDDKDGPAGNPTFKTVEDAARGLGIEPELLFLEDDESRLVSWFRGSGDDDRTEILGLAERSFRRNREQSGFGKGGL